MPTIPALFYRASITDLPQLFRDIPLVAAAASTWHAMLAVVCARRVYERHGEATTAEREIKAAWTVFDTLRDRIIPALEPLEDFYQFQRRCLRATTRAQVATTLDLFNCYIEEAVCPAARALQLMFQHVQPLVANRPVDIPGGFMHFTPDGPATGGALQPDRQCWSVVAEHGNNIAKAYNLRHAVDISTGHKSPKVVIASVLQMMDVLRAIAYDKMMVQVHYAGRADDSRALSEMSYYNDAGADAWYDMVMSAAGQVPLARLRYSRAMWTGRTRPVVPQPDDFISIAASGCIATSTDGILSVGAGGVMAPRIVKGAFSTRDITGWPIW